MCVGSVGWACSTNTSHQRQVSGWQFTSIPEQKAGARLPGRSRKKIFCLPVAPWRQHTTPPAPMEPHTAVSSVDNSAFMLQSNSVGWGSPRFWCGSQGSNLSSAAYHLSEHRGTDGLPGPPGPHLQNRVHKTHTPRSSSRVKEVMHVQHLKQCERSKDVSRVHLGFLAFVFFFHFPLLNKATFFQKMKCSVRACVQFLNTYFMQTD